MRRRSMNEIVKLSWQHGAPSMPRTVARVLLEMQGRIQVPWKKEPHNPVSQREKHEISRDRISHVFNKEVVILAYSDSNRSDTSSQVHVKPHCVRHVATSLSAQRYSLWAMYWKHVHGLRPACFLVLCTKFFTNTVSKLSHVAVS